MPTPDPLAATIALNLASQLVLDFVPLGRWNRLEPKTPTHRAMEALLNYSPLALMAWAATQPGAGAALGVLLGALLYLAGHVHAWWRPYLFGATERERADFARHFAGTARFLPLRHGMAPDAAHTVVGALTLATAVLAALRALG